jgi:hypothetical protein
MDVHPDRIEKRHAIGDGMGQQIVTQRALRRFLRATSGRLSGQSGSARCWRVWGVPLTARQTGNATAFAAPGATDRSSRII